MDKLCPKCGTQLQPDQAFCNQCGAAWTDGSAAAPQIAPSAKTGGSGKTLGVIAILLVIGLGIGGWLFVTHRAVAAPVVNTSTIAATTSATATVATATDAVAAVVPPLTDTTSPAAIDAATEIAAKSKPCSVISREDMGAILGKKIVKLTNTELSCSYFTDAEASAQVDTTWTGGKAAMAETKTFNSGEGLLTPVPAIGDEAYSQAAGVLHVLKGDTYVVVNSREYENHDESEIAIAKKIMERMQ